MAYLLPALKHRAAEHGSAGAGAVPERRVGPQHHAGEEVVATPLVRELRQRAAKHGSSGAVEPVRCENGRWRG